MLIRDDSNGILLQIKGYIDSSTSVLKKDLYDFFNQKIQDLKNYVDNRNKSNENNVTEKIEQKLEQIKSELSAHMTTQLDRELAIIKNMATDFQFIKNELISQKKEINELKKRASDSENKFKNMKTVL